MIKFNQYIAKDGIYKVETAINKTESITSCEIVPVVIDYADDYPHASLLFGFIFSLLSVSIAWFIFPPVKANHYFWPSEFQLEYLGFIIAVLIISFLIGGFLAQKFPNLKLCFLSPQNMRDKVINKAVHAFYSFHAGKTIDNTGIVIAVSLFEQMVHVQGDIGVNKHFTQAHWNSVRDKIIVGIKKNNLAQGLCDGIAEIGNVVREKLPIKQNDQNELINKLYFCKLTSLKNDQMMHL